MNQKFFAGDLVYINKLPEHSSHFRQECNAIVIASYAEQFSHSPNNTRNFTLYILDEYGGQCSWYDEDYLDLLESDRFDLLPSDNIYRINWENKAKRENHASI